MLTFWKACSMTWTTVWKVTGPWITEESFLEALLQLHQNQVQTAFSPFMVRFHCFIVLAIHSSLARQEAVHAWNPELHGSSQGSECLHSLDFVIITSTSQNFQLNFYNFLSGLSVPGSTEVLGFSRRDRFSDRATYSKPSNPFPVPRTSSCKQLAPSCLVTHKTGARNWIHHTKCWCMCWNPINPFGTECLVWGIHRKGATRADLGISHQTTEMPSQEHGQRYLDTVLEQSYTLCTKNSGSNR